MHTTVFTSESATELVIMASNPASRTEAVTKKLIENLQSDLRQLSSDTKRKYPPVKEVRGPTGDVVSSCTVCFK